MRLARVTTFDDQSLECLVEVVSVVMLYFVSTGRNAWWSTWTSRYSPGCMHTTLDSAKAHCEKLRKSGTVFYIDELPSLALLSSSNALLVSEINTRKPFRDLQYPEFAKLTKLIPAATMSLRQLGYLFNGGSSLWPTRYANRDSILLHSGIGLSVLEATAADTGVFSFSSRGGSASRRLRWSKKAVGLDSMALCVATAHISAEVSGVT
jgi:hypothetical protein